MVRKPYTRYSADITEYHPKKHQQRLPPPNQQEQNSINFPVLFHHKLSANPWNPWDPHNRNDERAYNIVNKPGGIGTDTQPRPQIINKLRSCDYDRNEYLVINKDNYATIDHVSVDEQEYNRNMRGKRERGPRKRGRARQRGQRGNRGRGRGRGRENSSGFEGSHKGGRGRGYVRIV